MAKVANSIYDLLSDNLIQKSSLIERFKLRRFHDILFVKVSQHLDRPEPTPTVPTLLTSLYLLGVPSKLEKHGHGKKKTL